MKSLPVFLPPCLQEVFRQLRLLPPRKLKLLPRTRQLPPQPRRSRCNMLEQELAVVRLKVPELPPKLARQAVELVQKLRTMELRKFPSISETLDWAKALVMLNADSLDKKTLESTLSVLLKHESDLQQARRQLFNASPPRDRRSDSPFGAARWQN